MTIKKNDIEKFCKVVKTAMDSDIIYDRDIESIDFFNLFLSLSEDKLAGNFNKIPLAITKYKYEGSNALMVIFSIVPMCDDYEKKSYLSKDQNELILNLIKLVEESLIFVDYINIKEESKYTFLVIIKKIKGDF
ncbi:MAG: hypothetical protein BWY04_01015 [candidate division CPR1 bacterium ADurb.Bin160]|uniref:Uncharacterized protein n=1 Tax=candidate division CPR1 bacterium ADurb.Bin160 TaxID=1852826 RepID=A0A1V5ZLP0_9BACT|nr:MAG: hypothetical protein BWY04_01015 [candidate division CPR1 bacterium ADurb.Bin160]